MRELRLVRLGAWRRVCVRVNRIVLLVLSIVFFVLPGCLLVQQLADPALRGPGIPAFAWRLHRQLSPRYARWARQRMASGRAGDLPLYDVPSTEWPIFGSVFYLLATEQLQAAWDAGDRRSPRAPREYARDTVDAAKDLILDPVHHTWVRQHWGDDYLQRENVFFRSLLIAGLASHTQLSGDTTHVEFLAEQASTLAAELDASRHGILDDYPGECYPLDVLAAVGWIRGSDRVTGLDHRDFVARARRAFSGDMLDELGMVPFISDPDTAEIFQGSRGTGNSWVLVFAPDLWPDAALRWYALYSQHFWQERGVAAGFREFPPHVPGREWSYDVDAGPIIAGFSPAANAFGVAAARVNGRFDHAWPLSAQVLAAMWPLPGGTRLGARILSNAVHAPYLGEAALLYMFTCQPAPGVVAVGAGNRRLPLLIGIAFLFYFGLGIGIPLQVLRATMRERRNTARPAPVGTRDGVEVLLWLVLLVACPALMLSGHGGVGMMTLLAAQLLPRPVRRVVNGKGTDTPITPGRALFPRSKH